MYLLEIARGLSKMQTIDAAQMIAYFICLLYMSVRKFSRNHNGYCRLFFANLVKLSWLCLEGNITNKLDQWYVWNCMDMLGLRTWGSAFLTCLSCMQDAFNKQARWALRLQSCGRNPFSTSNANPVLCKKCIPLSKDTKERTVNWLQCTSCALGCDAIFRFLARSQPPPVLMRSKCNRPCKAKKFRRKIVWFNHVKSVYIITSYTWSVGAAGKGMQNF